MQKVIRLIFFLTIFILLVGCMGCHKNNEEDQMDSIFFSGIYEYKDWDDDIGTYKHPVIPNQDVAIAVATQIFRGMVDNNLRENYVPQMVFYDNLDRIFLGE